MKFFFLITYIMTFFVTNSFGQQKKTKMTINGKIMGFADNTKLYLNDLTDGTYNLIDSTIITNNEFVFTRLLKPKALKLGITTKDNEDRVSFWGENKIISFGTEKGKFRTAKIIGSKSEDEQQVYYGLFDTAKNASRVKYSFIKNHPNSIVSITSLYENRQTWSKDTIDRLYKSLSKEIRLNYYGNNVNDFLLLNKNLKIGDNFIDFNQTDTLGKKVKLSDFKGKIILLEFWGSWCEGCRENNIIFKKIYEEYNSKGFEIFGVAAETKRSSWTKAIIMDNLPWINVTDFKGDKNKAAIIYGVNDYPTNYLIDRNGKIVGKELYGEKLKAVLSKIL